MSRKFGAFNPASTATTTVLAVTSAVSLYLPFDTDFSDLSNFNHTPTESFNGAQYVQTSVAQFGGSAFFDNNDDYVTYDNHPSFIFGSEDFTVEGFFNASEVGSDGLIGVWGGPSSGLRCWLISFSLGRLYAAFSLDGNSATSLDSGVTISTGQWYNFSFTREGSTFRLFVDGVLKATATNSGSLKNSSQDLAVGSNNQSLTSLEYFGYLDDIRIIKGQAVYTTAYSVPTGPVGFITDTRSHSHVWNYPDIYKARRADTWPTVIPPTRTIQIHVAGGGGGGGGQNAGGDGGDGGVVSVQKTGVTAGTILTYVVGGGGKGGFYADGTRSSGQVIGITSGPMAGGGALVASDGDFSSSVNQSGAEGGAGSGVFLSTATQANAIVIAGGGGGGAGNNNGEGGAGGGQGTASDSSLVGQDGQGGSNQGEGGQSSRGGRHGNGNTSRTTASALLGQTNIYGGFGYTSGGGGGGGYYGGGGGGHSNVSSGMGGAGGGSGYVSSEWTRIESILSLPAGGAHATTGADGSNGKVVIIVDGSTAVSVTSTGTTATYEVV